MDAKARRTPAGGSPLPEGIVPPLPLLLLLLMLLLLLTLLLSWRCCNRFLFSGGEGEIVRL